MIIKIKEELYNREGVLRWSETKDVELNSSWYTPQCYFNDNHLSEIMDDDSDLGKVVLLWQGKTYEFKRKKNDD